MVAMRAQGLISPWLCGDKVNKATQVQADLTAVLGITNPSDRCLWVGSYFYLTGPAASTVSASFPRLHWHVQLLD